MIYVIVIVTSRKLYIGVGRGKINPREAHKLNAHPIFLGYTGIYEKNKGTNENVSA